jgi:hypothetical protein
MNHYSERSCSVKGELQEVTEEAERKISGRKPLIVGEVRRGKCGKRDNSRKAARRKP